MKDSFDDMIDRFGSPHLWGPFEWWINLWRLIGQYIEIRVIIDVATRCPDEVLRKQAIAKLRDELEVKRLDDMMPGKGCFEYDWAGLTRIRLAREAAQKESHDATDREGPGPVDGAHHEGGG